MVYIYIGPPWWLTGKESTNQETRFDLWVGKIPWRRKWQPTTMFLPRKSHGQRSLIFLVNFFLFHYGLLLQDIEHYSLCYTAGPFIYPFCL